MKARCQITNYGRPLMGVALLLLSAQAVGATGPDAQCARWRAAFADMLVRHVTVERGGRRIVLRVKVADTPERQAAGFQCATRKEILRTRILFDFGGEVLSPFHMQNVPAPLDIAFAKGDGRIFAILRMDPSPTALYGPSEAFRYALEARDGFFAREGIQAGVARLIANEGPRSWLKPGPWISGQRDQKVRSASVRERRDVPVA